MNNKTIFWLIIIFILTIYLFSKYDIGINILLGFIVAFIIIIYLYNNVKTIENEKQKIIKNKHNLIIPEQKISKKYNDVVDFLFSIQDFYIHCPLNYIQMVESIDNFFKTYEEILIDNNSINMNYSILIDQKRNALNSLSMITYGLSANISYDKKLQNSIVYLTNLLDTFINNIIENHKDILFYKGYNNKTKIINNDKIVPYNTYEMNNFSNNNLITYMLY